MAATEEYYSDDHKNALNDLRINALIEDDKRWAQRQKCYICRRKGNNPCRDSSSWIIPLDDTMFLKQVAHCCWECAQMFVLSSHHKYIPMKNGRFEICNVCHCTVPIAGYIYKISSQEDWFDGPHRLDDKRVCRECYYKFSDKMNLEKREAHRPEIYYDYPFYTWSLNNI